jgi:hypothetical protein
MKAKRRREGLMINRKKCYWLIKIFDQSIFSHDKAQMELSGAAPNIFTLFTSHTLQRTVGCGQRGWAKYRDSENFKGLQVAALNYGVKTAPVPLPEIFPARGGPLRTDRKPEMTWGPSLKSL